MVLLFAEQPYSEPVMKLPAAKRQRVDALTLDLTRVHAAEAFDWTATPLEMLTLEVERLPEPPDSSDWAVAVPALDEAAGSLLVTNFFPEQPMPAEPQTEMHEPPPAQVEVPGGQPGSALEMAEPDMDNALERLEPRRPKRRRRLPIPGHVLGVDETMELPEAHVEVGALTSKMLTTYSEELLE
ncbi:unnamed protein product, partial [Durusdinium trenchii]